MNVKVNTPFGIGIIKNPEVEELSDLIELLHNENLDLRRLQLTAAESYLSKGEETTISNWKSGIQKLIELQKTMQNT